MTKNFSKSEFMSKCGADMPEEVLKLDGIIEKNNYGF